jgi:hypothetical protein
MTNQLRTDLIAIFVRRGHKGKEIVEEVREIEALLDGQRCEWKRISPCYGGGYNYKNCDGYEFKIHSYFEKHLYCPYCGERISIKEVKDGQG